MPSKLLVVVPPHASSMGNGPPLAPILLRHHFGAIGRVEIFDANAFLFAWLLDHSRRELVTAHIGRELIHLLDQPLLTEPDLARLGRFMSFREGPYARAGEMSFARTGIDWAVVDHLMLSESPHERDADFGRTLWTAALDAIACEILALQPEHLAFSLLFDTQLEAAVALAQRVHAAGFGGQILLGGAVLKLADDSAVAVLLRQSQAQFAFRFNVYRELEGLRDYLSRRICATDVAHGSTLDETGKLVTNRSQAAPTASLPGEIDYSDLSIENYQTPRIFPVLLSEGCYWGKCEFCDYPYLSSNDPFVVSVMFRDPKAVVADTLSIQRQYGVESIDLISDAVPLAYFRRLRDADGERLRVNGLRLGCSIRAEPKAKREDFENMVACGVDSITIGIESLCDGALEGMKKGNTYNDIVKNLTFAKDAGLRVKGNFIYDYPRLSVEDIAMTESRLDTIAPLLDGVGVHSFSLSSRAPAAWSPNAAGLRVLGPRVSADHGGHHLAFELVNDSPALRRAHATLRDRLAGLAYVLERPAPATGKSYKLPYVWKDSIAVRSVDGSRLHVRIPGEDAPFLFYLCEDERS
jgi:hypothetical protein